MKVCLSCKHLTTGTGKFCSGCGRSWRRVCAGCGQQAGREARFCPACGEGNWVAETCRFVDLSLMPPTLAVLTGVWTIAWTIRHLGLVGTWLLRAALTLIAAIFGTSPCGVIGWVTRGLVWLLLLWLLGWWLALLPSKGGAIGTWLRGLPVRVLGIAGLGGRLLMRLSIRLFTRAILPKSSHNAGAKTSAKSGKQTNSP